MQPHPPLERLTPSIRTDTMPFDLSEAVLVLRRTVAQIILDPAC